MSTFSLDLAALTVIATDEHGEAFDLNAGGARCVDRADLAWWIRELCAQGAFDAATRDELLADLAE